MPNGQSSFLNRRTTDRNDGVVGTMARGFTALEAMPDYYKTAVCVVFAASFGIQSVTKMFKK